MKPLFTIHAGEYLVADHIERKFKKVNLWIPSRDTGTDLLVTDSSNKRAVSLQVKFSRDYLITHHTAEFQKPLQSCGWWTFNREKLAKSKADYWVLLVAGFERRVTDFIIIKPQELLERLSRIHGKPKTFQSYLSVTKSGQCWEVRGLKRQDQLVVAQDGSKDKVRDFSGFLNDWGAVKGLNG